MQQDKKESPWLKVEIIFGVLGIVLTIVLGFLAIHYSNTLKDYNNLSKWGLGRACSRWPVHYLQRGEHYPICSALLGGTLTLPTLLAARYGIWAPVWVALATALAACLGQFITYMIGYGGLGRFPKK